MILVLQVARELLTEHPDFTFTLDQAWSLIPYFLKEPEAQEDFRRWAAEGAGGVRGGHHGRPRPEPARGREPGPAVPQGQGLGPPRISMRSRDGLVHRHLRPPAPDAATPGPQRPPLLRFPARGATMERLASPDFHWEAPTAAGVLAHWFGCTYIGFTQIGDNPDEHLDMYFREMFSRLDWEGRRSPATALMVPFGSDFLRPRRDWFDFVLAWNRMCKPPLSFSLPREFFRFIEERNHDLPVTREEFNPVFTGGYESRIELKQQSRQASYLLQEAERWACLADRLGRRAFPAEEFSRAWELLLKCDSHDTTNGTGTDMVTRQARARFEEATAIAEARWEALSALGARDDWSPGRAGPWPTAWPGNGGSRWSSPARPGRLAPGGRPGTDLFLTAKGGSRLRRPYRPRPGLAHLPPASGRGRPGHRPASGGQGRLQPVLRRGLRGARHHPPGGPVHRQRHAQHHGSRGEACSTWRKT